MDVQNSDIFTQSKGKKVYEYTKEASAEVSVASPFHRFYQFLYFVRFSPSRICYMMSHTIKAISFEYCMQIQRHRSAVIKLATYSSLWRVSMACVTTTTLLRLGRRFIPPRSVYECLAPMLIHFQGSVPVRSRLRPILPI